MITYTYRIKGEPLHFIAGDKTIGNSWGRYKTEKMRYLIELESQQDIPNNLNHPLNLEIQLNCTQFHGQGDVSTYLRFIELMLKETVYNCYSDVVSVSIKRKKVSRSPSTVIIISEIEEE